MRLGAIHCLQLSHYDVFQWIIWARHAIRQKSKTTNSVSHYAYDNVFYLAYHNKMDKSF